MTIIKDSHDIFFYMKEIDKYYFPYVDEIEYILFNDFNLKEHVVYILDSYYENKMTIFQ